VGPSTAIVMLSYMNEQELKIAIVQENVAALQSIKGIGVKTAQRVIIELKDKLKKESWEETQPLIPSGLNNTVKREALSALLTLGLPKAVAEKSIDSVLKKSGNTITLEDLVKQALKNA
jgi:holliday junction DNA helicase RuvA